ncbi:hypothetical protein [Burkholderia sp. FERM BP-3421]|uniref:hypothetical protein n=1 Tax=Burkholderia sp. FERM BP-3421 TaxID=1494466 RepID=UPI003FCD9DE0
MSIVILDPAASAARAVPSGAPAVIRSAADVARLANQGATLGKARAVIVIALGGVFLDAYDLTSLAYGIKDIAKPFALTPAEVGFVSSAVVSSFSAALALARGGRFVACVPGRQTRQGRDGLHTFELPVETEGVTVSMMWHPRVEHDAAHRRQRERIRMACAA